MVPMLPNCADLVWRHPVRAFFEMRIAKHFREAAANVVFVFPVVNLPVSSPPVHRTGVVADELSVPLFL